MCTPKQTTAYIRNTQHASEKVGDDKDRCPTERERRMWVCSNSIYAVFAAGATDSVGPRIYCLIFGYLCAKLVRASSSTQTSIVVVVSHSTYHEFGIEISNVAAAAAVLGDCHTQQHSTASMDTVMLVSLIAHSAPAGWK